MKFKALLISLFLLLSSCSNENHIEAISDEERYFSEWQSFAEPYATDDELTVEEVNEKIDAGEMFFKANVNATSQRISSIDTYKGTELLWEDFYSTGSAGERFQTARSYRFTGGPYYFAELHRQTPYEMISFEDALLLQEAGLPYYSMSVTEPVMPTYTITKVGPSGDVWRQSISDTSITLTWLMEVLVETTHSIQPVIPKNGEMLPTMTYSNSDYGFSFEYIAYGFSLYDKNGNETENHVAELLQVFERHVSENESHFYIGPAATTLEKLEDPDSEYSKRALHVIKLKTGSEEELNQAIKEHWGYFCEYQSSAGTAIDLDSIIVDTMEGVEAISCRAGEAWYDHERKILYLNSTGSGDIFGYNDWTFNPIPKNIRPL